MVSLALTDHVDGLRAHGSAGLGDRLVASMARLYPICRSLTGDGVRQTLDVLGESVDVARRSVPSGTTAFDWTVNEEWNVRDAYVADPTGRRVIDFRESNLHLVGYSIPVRATMSLEELRPHLHSLPEHPDWIPYRTSYYSRSWGFCVADRVLQELGPGPYDVVIDTELTAGELTYGEVVIPGDSDEEVMITSHVCHPSLANDNLTGLVVATEIARLLAALPRRRFTYRFLFAPGTVGPIVWLSRNEAVVPRIRHGLVLTGLGGPGPLVYKRTRRASAAIDAAVSHVVRRRGGEVRDYSPYGYDERQFNSIGFGLPFGRLSRTPHGEYPEYHTSADNLAYVTAGELVESYTAICEVLDVLEHDDRHLNLSPFGEPQLGKRGIYPTTGGLAATKAVMAMLWTLAYSDGTCSALEIAATADLDFADIRQAVSTLTTAGLLSSA